MVASTWPDRVAYPFADRFFAAEGGRMHYLDEGQGEPIVFVHGTPEWSFVYRHLIRELAPCYRCIAPDHIGFGLSDKPPTWSYTPQDHARNLQALIAHLGLQNITLVVHDYGGPIGLSYAIEQPENVRRLVIMNSWLWSFAGDARASSAGKLLAGPIGRFLYTRLNFSPRVLLPAAWANKSTLTPALHHQYLAAFPRPHDRLGAWGLARAVTGASDWFDSLWARRERIAHLPALLLWGLRDPAITPNYLDRWLQLFPQAQVQRLANAGHFVQEEAPQAVTAAVAQFLAAVVTSSPHVSSDQVIAGRSA